MRPIAVLSADMWSSRFIAEKFMPQPPRQEWLAPIGTYEALNELKQVFTGKNAQAEYATGTYTLTYDANDSIYTFNGQPLQIISEHEAVTGGVGRNAGETLRAYTENSQEYFWFSGYCLKRLTHHKKLSRPKLFFFLGGNLRKPYVTCLRTP
jgi:hypothetical protein